MRNAIKTTYQFLHEPSKGASGLLFLSLDSILLRQGFVLQ